MEKIKINRVTNQERIISVNMSISMGKFRALAKALEESKSTVAGDLLSMVRNATYFAGDDELKNIFN